MAFGLLEIFGGLAAGIVGGVGVIDGLQGLEDAREVGVGAALAAAVGHGRLRGLVCPAVHDDGGG